MERTGITSYRRKLDGPRGKTNAFFLGPTITLTKLDVISARVKSLPNSISGCHMCFLLLGA